ncbi:MAG: SDR family NAD(P)-dependent oxidoreductase [Pseudomonadales bacterium]|nr:SDR family NAD(P)-dependent oxidoreductase [Pseudomonadales bacterium]
MSKLAGTFFKTVSSMEGKLAVVTGAASGIGLEFSRRCVLDYGMRVVMADIETEQVKAEAAQLGALATAVSTDVRKRSDVEALLAVAQSCAMNGSVDVAFFNAGVLGAGVNVLKGTEEDWRWAMDINFFGVLHGLQTFTPALIKQQGPSLVAVTASTQGLDIGGPPGSTAVYTASKHALVATMESLEGELAFKQLDNRIQLAVLCPGLVSTGIWDTGKSESHRGSSARADVAAREAQRHFFETQGTSTQETIQTFLAGVANGQFICDSVPGQARTVFARRAEYVMGGRMPSDHRTTMG